MSSTIYVIRPSEQSIARSVCLKESAGVVVSLDNAIPPGKVEKSVKPSLIQQGEKLTYDQVLVLLLKADKVITL
jgi:hypothetical protein